MDDFNNLSEEDLQQLMALGVIPDQQSSLEDQIQQAQLIRNRQAPKGYDTGRVYVAANPLEHLARALQGIQAGRELKNLRSEQQKLLAEQIRGRKMFFDRMRTPAVSPEIQRDVDMGY